MNNLLSVNLGIGNVKIMLDVIFYFLVVVSLISGFISLTSLLSEKKDNSRIKLHGISNIIFIASFILLFLMIQLLKDS